MPDAPRPYRTFGYPLVPALFLLVSGWLVVNTAIARPVESAAGIVLILAGLPVYAWFHAEQRRTKALAREGGSALDRAHERLHHGEASMSASALPASASGYSRVTRLDQRKRSRWRAIS
jgi:Flp pilus assembly protein TadB